MVKVLEGLSPMGQFEEKIATGIGSGLQSLAQNKIKSLMDQQQEQGLINANVNPAVAKLFTLFPGLQKELLNRLEVKDGSGVQGIGLGLTQQQQLKKQQDLEKRRDKLRPEFQYITEMDDTIDQLIELAKNPDVEFGSKSSVLANLPMDIGKYQLNEATSSFHTLTNKFVTDALQKAKGVRGQYLARIYEKTKPSLGKTKEQNLRDLMFYKKQSEATKQRFKKDYPGYFDEDLSLKEQRGPGQESLTLNESVEQSPAGSSEGSSKKLKYKGRDIQFIKKNTDGTLQVKDVLTGKEFKIPKISQG